jgi:hypothetical protein
MKQKLFDFSKILIVLAILSPTFGLGSNNMRDTNKTFFKTISSKGATYCLKCTGDPNGSFTCKKIECPKEDPKK